MLFNSLDFALFLPTVFFLYWFVFNKNIRLRNAFLVIVSYIFYGWWDWRFLSLIFISSLVDYFVGIGIYQSQSQARKKLLLGISLLVNLGMLGFFKYYNFFMDNFVEVFRFFGHSFSYERLKIILPVGISFYTFQTLSYSIDVYRGKLSATRDFIAFLAFVSFFPQLVAGPIERAAHLLPQFYEEKEFDYSEAVDGMRQMLWGFFKKIVIADTAANYVNNIFANYETFEGSTLLLGALLFTFQIYGDFSGYSDIAIGTARLFGFDLMQNFAYPYFSRDIAEFWRRWHISLSSWFRDYLYIPLGGSRVGLWKRIRNVFIIFIVSGFWHGANWTFIIWGALNALYFLPLMLLNLNRVNTNTVAEGRFFPSIKEIIQMSITFFLTVLAWIFFRSQSVSQAFAFVKKIFSTSLFQAISIDVPNRLLLIIFLSMLVEWIGRHYKHPLHSVTFIKWALIRYSIYIGIVVIILLVGTFAQNEFIYFQF